MKKFFAILFAACLLPSMLFAATSNYTVTIGDRFPYDLSVVVPKDAQVIFPTADNTFAPFELKAFKLSKAVAAYQTNGVPSKKIVGNYTLAVYDLGDFYIPTVTVVVKEAANAGSVVFPPVRVTVKPVAKGPRDRDDMRDVTGPLSIPYTLRDIMLGLLVLTGLLLLGWFLWRKYKSKKIKPEPEPEVTPLTAFEEAQRKLTDIGERDLTDEESFKVFYTDVSDVIREYLYKEFSIDALEMTTSELMTSLKRFRFSWEELDVIREWLNNSDLVKFARFIPGRADAVSHLSVAHKLLESFYKAYLAQRAADELATRETTLS